ncbi:2-polyprenylphenol hydroxylase [Metallosphaera cuprina]|uniref:2-polyprenylphenol hydroxylase n=1 Tax=Metallosphaera cuprina (strain Ar-4) TaxID=1006006 RepID=F4FZC1_METCR|nr:2-polyprenylphenol hydroxylase [Metallosphaera cuprina]AEB94430.1 conserved hypothetical protein [Metallosphaera cuprina Ar-4]
MISKVLEVHKEGRFTRFIISYDGKKPKAGQFVALVFPSEKEIPLGVADYREGELEIYVDSSQLASWIESRERVTIEGPFGRPLLLGNTMGITTRELHHDVLYPLREARRSGYDVSLKCLDGCEVNFPKKERDRWDVIIASLPKGRIREVPPKTLIYVRWVKMNCMNGACGVCNVNGYLACVEGPFIEVEKVVDQG